MTVRRQPDAMIQRVSRICGSADFPAAHDMREFCKADENLTSHRKTRRGCADGTDHLQPVTLRNDALYFCGFIDMRHRHLLTCGMYGPHLTSRSPEAWAEISFLAGNIAADVRTSDHFPSAILRYDGLFFRRRFNWCGADICGDARDASRMRDFRGLRHGRESSSSRNPHAADVSCRQHQSLR